MNRSIAIVSGKGGVGKTTVTSNLTAALMQFKKNVIALDADIKMSGLGLQLGMYYFPVTLTDVLMEKASIFEAVYIHSCGMRIIPASLCVQNVKVSRLKQIIEDPFLDGNIILVDASPGLEKNTIAVLKACKEVIIVTIPEIPAVADVMKTLVAAKKTETKPLGIIINRYRRGERDQITAREIESTCDLPIIGVIPEDKTIAKSIFKRVPAVLLNPYSSSSIEFKKIAADLIGEKYTLPRFHSIKRFLRGLKK